MTIGLTVLLSVVLTSTSARADTISLLGDVDCFGLEVSCPDGSLFRDELGGFFFADNRENDDPTFTDLWAAFDAVSYTHSYVPGLAQSATLEMRIAGIHDRNLESPYDVIFNGTAIGTIGANASDDGFQEVLTYFFPVPLNLLTGNDVVSYSGLLGTLSSATDGFIIDYSRLTLTEQAMPSSPVPEPASLVLLGGGLVAAAARARRRRSVC